MFSFARAVIAAGLLLTPTPFAPLPAQAPAAAAPAPAPTAAAATVEANPALWVVRDKDTTIYLFGTFHLLKPRLNWFDRRVKAAFDASDELVTEVTEPDGDSAARLMLSLAVDPASPPLSTRLSAEARADYEAALKQLGMPIAAFEQFKPWAVALVVQISLFQKLGYGADAGAETVLNAAAKAAGKTRGELETTEFQLRLMDGMPMPVQIAFLEATVKSLPETGTALDRMLADWVAGDAKGLAIEMNDSIDENPELHRIMLADRNARWADWIATRMEKPGTVFVAVGAGHLAGKDSVQDYLKAKRLKARRVKGRIGR